MSRDRTKKFKHSRHARSGSWFRPSREDAALYGALLKAGRPLNIKELCEQTGAAPSTVDHTARFWTEKGLLARTFLDSKAWFSWAPQSRAKPMAEALAAALDLAEALPQAPKAAKAATTNPAAQALRAIAALLNSAADQLEQEKTS